MARKQAKRDTQPDLTQVSPMPPADLSTAVLPVRHHLADTRHSITHKFTINGHEGYITVGLYDNGQPGELFIKMAKEGSTMSGLVDTIGILTSIALQYGVPVDALVRKLEHMRFEPSGWTRNEDIRNADSVVDYIFRWLGRHFSPTNREEPSGRDIDPRRAPSLLAEKPTDVQQQGMSRPPLDGDVI